MTDRRGRTVVIEKVKRPAGVFTWNAHPLGEDEHGHWLFLGRSATWQAPHAAGRVSMDAVVLVSPDQPWVTWWVDDPADPRVELDICLPPAPSEQGHRWSYVDLELDPVLHVRTGQVEVQDWDEFGESVDAGVMDRACADLAVQTAQRLRHLLVGPTPGWLPLGWSRLARASGRPAPGPEPRAH